MFTANTMNCMAEVLGLALPATERYRRSMPGVRQPSAGAKIMELLEKILSARHHDA